MACRQTWCFVGLVLVLSEPSTVKAAAAVSLPLQPGDALVEPLKPVRPRSEEVGKQLDAVSWYMEGRLLQSRGRLKEALEAYRHAAELDAGEIEIYRSLVPLAMQLNMADEAVRLAMKAVELDPEDYDLQLQIGLQFARQEDFANAIKHLEHAAKSDRLSKESPTYVMLNVELGMLYQLSKQPEKAAEAYKIVFDAIKTPGKYNLDFRARSSLLSDQRTSYERIGQVLMEGKLLDLASEAFDLAAKSNRVSAGNLMFYRARILLQKDQPEAALAELQKYLDEQRQSKGREAYVLLEEVLVKLDRHEELIGRLEALSKKDPRNRQLQYFFADSLANAGELEEAKKVYEAALDGGGDASGFLGLAGVLRRLQRADELLDVLGRGLSKLGEDGLPKFDTELKAVIADQALVDALVAAGRAQSKAEPRQLSFEESYLLGKIASELERYNEAIEFYRLAATLDKDRAILAYRDLAEVLMQAQQYSEAATAYSDALKLPLPQQLKAQFLLGLTQSRELAGDTPGALEAVAEARREFPGVPLFEFQEAWIFYHSRQFDEAIKRFEQLIETYPDAKDTVRRSQFSLSAIYTLKGDIAKGEKILEDVYAEEPDDPAVNNDLGYLYADQGKNLEKAEQMIRKAVAAEPDNPAYLDSLGWVLFKLGKYQDAVGPLEKAANAQTGGDGTIWDHLGDAYEKLNRSSDAQSAWKKALEKAEAEKFSDAKLIEKIRAKLGDAAPAATDKEDKAAANDASGKK